MIKAMRVILAATVAPIFFAHQIVLAKDVLIAARDDARPFVWKDPDTKTYRGFFWDICTLATQRAGYFPKTPDPVFTAEDRTAFLNGAVPDFDLLCDPTTITISRLNTFVANGSYLTFSPIIFVANGTYFSPTSPYEERKGEGKIPPLIQKAGSKCDDLKNWSEDISATDHSRGLQEDEKWIRFAPKATTDLKASDKDSYEIWGSLKGSTIDEKLRQADILAEVNKSSSALVCATAFSSHQDAAKAFCNGRLARYYGDGEIVKAAIHAQEEESGKACKYVTAPLGTYEPYAFVLSARKFPDFPLKFTLALYTLFADQTIERLFAAHFSEDKSDYLDTLFRINRVPYGLPAKQ